MRFIAEKLRSAVADVTAKHNTSWMNLLSPETQAPSVEVERERLENLVAR